MSAQETSIWLAILNNEERAIKLQNGGLSTVAAAAAGAGGASVGNGIGQEIISGELPTGRSANSLQLLEGSGAATSSAGQQNGQRKTGTGAAAATGRLDQRRGDGSSSTFDKRLDGHPSSGL
ncbi:unnamed protein product [Closterium sp. NIES-54]